MSYHRIPMFLTIGCDLLAKYSLGLVTSSHVTCCSDTRCASCMRSEKERVDVDDVVEGAERGGAEGAGVVRVSS